MPISNFGKPLGSRTLVEQVQKKSQMWAGFMVPSLAFLFGFFKDNLASITVLILAIGISWLFFIFAMELADYSSVNWHAVVAEGMYYLGGIALFAGLLVYSSNQSALSGFSGLFVIPVAFYGFMMVFSPLLDAVTIYRSP